jgi:adenosylcobyric acid synthase
VVHEVIPGLAWQSANGQILGCYLHGLFEDERVLQALFGTTVPTLEQVFDGLADYVEQHAAPGGWQRLLLG